MSPGRTDNPLDWCSHLQREVRAEECGASHKRGEDIMKQPIRILGIAGSLRRESYNRAALRAATRFVPEGAILETFELDGIPVFNQDEEQNPPSKVSDLKRRIRPPAPVLFPTPEYNYSLPGLLKDAID